MGTEGNGVEEWAENDTAAALEACLRCCPVAIAVDPGRNGYSVRDGRGAFIWADDLPEGGVSALIEAFLLLVHPSGRAALRETMTAREGRWTGQLAALAPIGRVPRDACFSVRVEAQEDGALCLTVARQSACDA